MHGLCNRSAARGQGPFTCHQGNAAFFFVRVFATVSKKEAGGNRGGGNSICADFFESGGLFQTRGECWFVTVRSSGGRGARGDRKSNIPFPATWILRDDVRLLGGLIFPETIHGVVVHHADSLHVGIHRGAADEVESGFFQRLGKRIRLGRAGDEIIE